MQLGHAHRLLRQQIQATRHPPPHTPCDSGLQGLRKGPNALRWGLDRQMHAAQDRPRTALPARQAAALPTQP